MNTCPFDHDTCTRHHIHCADCGIRVQTVAIGKNGHTYCGHCYGKHVLGGMGLELHRYWLETIGQKEAIYRFYTDGEEFLGTLASPELLHFLAPVCGFEQEGTK